MTAACLGPLIEAPVTSVSLSAEHATIELGAPTMSINVGDKIEFIVGYTDTTTMLHDEVYGTRDGKVEVMWPILGPRQAAVARLAERPTTLA